MKPKAQSEHDTGMLEFLEDIIGTGSNSPLSSWLRRSRSTTRGLRSSTELLVYYCSMGCLSEDWNYHKVTCRSAGGYLGTAWEEEREAFTRKLINLQMKVRAPEIIRGENYLAQLPRPHLFSDTSTDFPTFNSEITET